MVLGFIYDYVTDKLANGYECRIYHLFRIMPVLSTTQVFYVICAFVNFGCHAVSGSKCFNYFMIPLLGREFQRFFSPLVHAVSV